MHHPQPVIAQFVPFDKSHCLYQGLIIDLKVHCLKWLKRAVLKVLVSAVLYHLARY